MEKVRVTYKNNVKEFPKGTTYFEISEDFAVKEDILAVEIDNVIYHLSDKVREDCSIRFIDLSDDMGNKIYKNSIKFLFEVALKRTLNNAEVFYEHSVPKGVVASIIYENEISYNDLNNIKREMYNLVSDNYLIKKYTILKSEAIEYYKKNNYEEKALNVQHISDKVVTLFELDGYFNYFYTSMAYNTGVLKKYEIKSIGRNKIIIIPPDKHGNIPDYSNCHNIINSFYRGKCLLNDLNINYLADLNQEILDLKIKEFIKSCELVFDLNLASAAKKICDNKNIKFVMIAGPSSSGKTTTCKRLADYLRANGYDPIMFSIDDYFVDREETPLDEEGNKDYESINSIDIDLLNNDLEDLLNNKKVQMKRYNFITGKKELLDKELEMKENTIFLIEGLHALNDELTPKIGAKYKYKIYLSPFIPLNIDRHNYISTIDLRLIRRVIRDSRTRGYDIVHTMDKWKSVRKGEEKYIFPYVSQADVVINTALAYEVGVLKVYIEPLLYSVDINNKYYEEARRIINFLKPFFSIPSEYVPENSILREFIGGKYND